MENEEDKWQVREKKSPADCLRGLLLSERGGVI
jgi:hypothetical protein